MNKQNANNDGVLDDQSSNVGAPLISLVTPPPPLQLQRMSSIESEPKTLFHGELNIAREAAIEVLNNHPREQALEIFLAPVEIAKDATEDNIGSDLDDEE
ncbi:uncharacterized protein LOC107460635 isoform X2 [Arachis duranensis]|uniref:Uncharacterized protein LOC107460635 isoform X2 n=1 Tax=Arachis duranensis TaxID=130453 RepID=A0A9C6T7C8_ARADU|nr:uncharacterized protein LOC107460635 isoform X2 [Arachis duranensis]